MLLMLLSAFQQGDIENNVLNTTASCISQVADVMGGYIFIAQHELENVVKQIHGFDNMVVITKEVNTIKIPSGLYNSLTTVSNKYAVIISILSALIVKRT